MNHAFYVYTSYGITAAVIVVLICRTWFDGRARRRELAELDAAGIRRRSARPVATATDGVSA